VLDQEKLLCASMVLVANVCGINGMGSRSNKNRKGSDEASITQDGAVDLQHGTGVDANLRPCSILSSFCI
jgi:hypothetical protein